MFEGQAAIVTGAGRGIGRAVAERLSRAGAGVVCTARTTSELDTLVQELRDAGGRAIAVTADVTKPEDVERLVATTVKEFGRIDVLVNNAGTVQPSPLVDMSFELWRSTLAVNLDSIYLTCHAVAPHMIAARRGRIVNVASISGVRGSQKFPGFTAYAAAKAGVIVFTEALAAELREHGIRVNAISPGSVDTPLLRAVAPDLEAGMSAAEVAESIAFLAGDGSRPVNGTNLEIFG